MPDEKQELLAAWDLLVQLEKVIRMLWSRYCPAFTEFDRAEVERKQSMESDTNQF